MPKDSMFNPGSNVSGGGSGGSVTVVNNLNSTSPTDALSANQGRILNTMITDHSKMMAGVGSTGNLGHVRVDGSTITIDANTGVISSVGGSGGDAVAHAQAILPTTVVDQETWKIPFTDYKYPDDLLIVTHNSTVVDTSRYSITQNIDGVSWDVTIPKNPLYPRPIADNNVFVIMVKGMGTGGGTDVVVEDILTSTSTINALSANMGRALKVLLEEHEATIASKTELGHVKVDDVTIKIDADGRISAENLIGLRSYEYILPTTVVNQNKWTIPLDTFDPTVDTVIVSHNTTLLDTDMYQITKENDDYIVRILTTIPSEIQYNNVFIIILKNVIATTDNGVVTGKVIADGSIEYGKLDQDLKDRIDAGGATIVDDLLSTDATKVLSANMGRELKSLLDDHEKVEASKTTLGHVKIDDLTIRINQDGEIYVDAPNESNTKLESYQYVLPTTTVGQTEWEIPLASFDKDNDTILVSHNTTLLTNRMYELSTVANKQYVKITETLPSEIDKNNVFIVILKNVITDGTSMISGSILIDKTVTEDKLSQDVQDKLNSSGSPQWGTF